MIVVAGSLDVDIKKFIELVNQSDCDFIAVDFNEWQQQNNNYIINNNIPDAFVYIRVDPEVTAKKLLKMGRSIDYKMILKNHAHNENYFINKTTQPDILHCVPILVLNGIIDFETDFSQFYTHLFSIKKFYQNLIDERAKKKGTYVSRKKHSNCRC
jgi:hypothetical protein